MSLLALESLGSAWETSAVGRAISAVGTAWKFKRRRKKRKKQYFVQQAGGFTEKGSAEDAFAQKHREWVAAGMSAPMDVTPAKESKKRKNETVAVKPDTLRVSLSSFGTATNVHIVGDIDRIQVPRRVVLKGPSGRMFARSKYLYCKKLFSPFIMSIGECLTTTSSTTSTQPDLVQAAVLAPTHIIIGTSDYTAFHNRWCEYPLTKVQKWQPKDQSVMIFEGQRANQYLFVNIPILPNHNYGERGISSGATTQPFGLQDIWTQFFNGTTTSGGIYDQNPACLGSMPYQFMALNNADNFAFTGGNPSQPYDNQEAYIWVTTAFNIINPLNSSQYYELSVLGPKGILKSSPLFDLGNEYTNTVNQEDIYEYSNVQYLNPDRGLFEMRGFRKKWKLLSQTKVLVEGNNAIEVKVRLPLSKVDYATLKRDLEGGTFTSLPGLTSWLVIRGLGTRGWNSTTGGYGYSPASVGIQMRQKVGILNGYPNIVKKMNLLKYETATGWFIEDASADAQSTNPTGPITNNST